jgi:hypothetical protein
VRVIKKDDEGTGTTNRRVRVMGRMRKEQEQRVGG